MKSTASQILPLVFLGVALAQEGGVDPYAPDYVECPSNLSVRSAQDGLSDEEQSWRRRRGEKVRGSLASYLRTANIEGLDVDELVNDLGNDNYPIIGLSISGGGTQSGFGGLGIWQAFDDRYPPAVQAGTGGLTQLLSYISGLSGGGCVAVSTIAANDFKSLEEMNQNVNYTVDYTAGPSGNQSEFIGGIFENVGAKAEAGFPISVTDAFGQFWANYIPEDWMFKNYSEIASDGSVFSEGDGPMPIIVLTEVIPGQSPEIGNIMYPGNNATNGFNITSYEVTPLEFGSWAGGRIQAFIPTEYLGTTMSNGSAANSSECARGFDKFTFIQGSTANAYPAWFIDAFYDIPIFAKRGLEARQDDNSNDIPIPPDQEGNPLVQLVNGTAENFNQTFNQSMWATYPNPFLGYNEAMANVDELLLLDGSLTGETNPIRPLIIPEREVDFVIVYEASSDAAPYNWVNGTNLINTALAAAEGNIPFPTIPDVATLVTQNLTKQPTFFGCNSNTTAPLVLYLPNSPWSGFSNYSYLQSQFTENQLNVTWENAFNLATYGNGTVEPDWPQCLACAAIRGTVQRARKTLPEKCRQCFQRHCWNGVRANRTVTDADLDPPLRLDPGLSYQEWNDTVWNEGIEGGSGGGNGSGGEGGSGSGGGSGGDGGSGSGGGDGSGGSGGGNGSGASVNGERLFGLAGHLAWIVLVLGLQGFLGL